MTINKIFDKYFNEVSLRLAWERVVRWTDRTTKDHFGIKMFGHNLTENLSNLSKQVISGSYKPTRPQKFYMPKSSKMQRTKSMLIIEDALVYQAIADTIAAENFDKFAENNDFVFGSVLSDEVGQGINILNAEGDKNLFFFKHYINLYKKFADSVNKAILEDKVTHKFETDITGFFDSIPHFSLLSILSEKFNVEEDILDILSECLNCWSGTREKYTFGVGIPQGAPPSFFLANALLNDFDNIIKGDGHIYYRYMDDIRIYAFNENELTAALVKIDAYLKGLALSLNAKKTSIEKVINDKTDNSIILFDFGYDDDDLLENPDFEAKDEFSSFAEQDGYEKNISEFKTIKDEDEIKEFWQNMHQISILDLLNLFELTKNKPTLKNEKIEDRIILEIAYQYRSAIKGLKKSDKDFKPDETMIPFWLYLLEKFPWRADHFCWIFNEFKDNEFLKEQLFKMIDIFQSYEWIRHHIYLTVAMSQTITKREWQELFRKLKSENDFYARLALYKLLLFHGLDNQQLAQVTKEITKENNGYMKKELLFYAKIKQAKKFTIQELIKSFGL